MPKCRAKLFLKGFDGCGQQMGAQYAQRWQMRIEKKKRHSLQSRMTATEQLHVVRKFILEPKTLLRLTEAKLQHTPMLQACLRR